MGIPSFYRQLCRRFPAIITKGAGAAPEWLCLDFNCAMYWVLRKMEPWTPETNGAWTTNFCKEIGDYLEELVALTQPTKGVYVSCDGVVCAAKRRQQRLRRFKGPWTSAAEAEVKRLAGSSASPTDKWDQNALTPGSQFMADLGLHLTHRGALIGARQRLTVIVSTTSEPGEGEHKLLAAMRTQRPATCAIYGLDADLILLAMLLHTETGADVRLLREAQEFERASEVDEWRTLNVPALTAALGLQEAHVSDFVAAMSLLGNDFLPKSLTHTVREDGIPDLLKLLTKELWSQGRCLIHKDGGLDRSSLLALVEQWAATEETDLLGVTAQARRARGRPTGVGATPEETALRAWNAQPATWATVLQLVRGSQLRPGWRDFYYRSWKAGSPEDYVRGVAWVWDYYSGRPVDLGWSFDAHLPPLWSDVAAALRSQKGEVIEPPPLVYTEALPEWVHLFSVLPAESIARLLPPSRQRLMATRPWFWPTRWSLFDVGRTQMWECEPDIPIIPEAVLRSLA